MATILIGHVTKDGSLAGPRTMEHLVDVVCYLEGDRHSRLRLLRAVKNRYGPTDEIGCFDLSESGMVPLPDPSSLFLSRHDKPVSGTSVTVTLEGRRPLLAEVQALVTPSATPNPRRTNSGLDGSRVALMLAVLDRRAGIRVGSNDVYLSTVGGVRLGEPANDLAIALAAASSVRDLPLPQRLVAIGEVGLAGEVRRVTGVSRRLSEAGRLGFTHAMVPAGTDDTAPDGMTVLEVPDLSTALQEAGMYAPRDQGGSRDGRRDDDPGGEPTQWGPRAVR
jgi:DNA repair protein RadA/Sms